MTDAIDDDTLFMDLFRMAMDLPRDSRQSRLFDASDGNQRLVERVIESVTIHEKMGDFLVEPLIPRADLDQRFQEGELVAGRFRIVREVGEGGMGVVYEAFDVKLDQRCALKCAKPGFAGQLPPEARNALRITDDHVCRIYGIYTDEIAGHSIDLLVMEFVDGETLSEQLARTGALDPIDAVDVALQLCAGLGAAHREGVLHRDLKSNNVMLTRSTDGRRRAVLMDFGVAAEAAGRGGMRDGGGKQIAGALAYMAPELWHGSSASIASDIYSLGIVFWEMLTGAAPPVSDPSGPPLLPDAVLSALDQRWQRCIRQCLAESPPRRPSSAAAVALMLDPASAMEVSRSDRNEPVSIAVLPFANLSGDGDNEYFTDGLTEEIMNTLACVPGVRVLARTSAYQFKGRAHDIRKIGKKLGIQTALEGSVRKEAHRIRVAAQLVSARDGFHLWAQIFDRELRDVFDIQQEITHAIVEALRIHLAPEDRDRLRRRGPVRIEAYDCYLRGRHFQRLATPAHLVRSVQYMERAIALDPRYAAAYAGMADAYLLWATIGTEPPAALLASAKRSAQTALEIEDLAEGHSALASALAIGDWDWAGAEREFRLALALKPLEDTRAAYAVTCLAPMRRHEEALVHLRRALSGDPLSVFLRTMLGQTLVMAGKPEAALAELRDVMELEPTFVFGNITLALTHLAMSSYSDALAVLERIHEAAEAFPNYLGHLGYAYARLGNRFEAVRTLNLLVDRFPKSCPAVDIAAIHNGLGDVTEALTWLRRAFQMRCFDSLFVVEDPRFVSLRTLREFRELARQTGVPLDRS